MLIERLAYDPQVLAAVEVQMAESGEPRGVVMARVERIAREIAPRSRPSPILRSARGWRG